VVITFQISVSLRTGCEGAAGYLGHGNAILPGFFTQIEIMAAAFRDKFMIGNFSDTPEYNMEAFSD
jgi:hypothetical protein